jgi:DNA-binding XRE family transcriptional regulator
MPNLNKYKPEFVEQAKKVMAEFGATHSELASFFGVGRQSIVNWMKKYPEFEEAVRAGAAVADAKVERSLFRRATGFVRKTQRPFLAKDGTAVAVDYEEEVPPSEVACIFWLKNRDPDGWRDVIRQWKSGEVNVLPSINIMLNTAAGQQTIAPAIDTTRSRGGSLEHIKQKAIAMRKKRGEEIEAERGEGQEES